MVQKLLHPCSPYHPSGAVSGAACCREKPVDAGGAFCYNVKAINGAVLKWSKRRDSKSRRPRKGCQGSNPCCSAKPNGQMEFSICPFSFVPSTMQKPLLPAAGGSRQNRRKGLLRQGREWGEFSIKRGSRLFSPGLRPGCGRQPKCPGRGSRSRSHWGRPGGHRPRCSGPPSCSSTRRRPSHKSQTAPGPCRSAGLLRQRTEAQIRSPPAVRRP